MTTLAGDGAVEFWIVDPKTPTVRVYSKSGGVRVYTEGAVPTPLFECPIRLDLLFAQ
jgi:Uma2 family endonuclease